MLLKQLQRTFSLEILRHLTFTPEFYHAVQTRLIPNNKHLVLDIKPGEGCGGFTYEFFSTADQPNTKSMSLTKNGSLYFSVEKDCILFLEGAIIDFEDDIHRAGFVVKENPNVELTCSCKRSFSPKTSIM